MCCFFFFPEFSLNQSIIGARMLERKWNIDLLGIQIDGTFNTLVVLRLHQSPKNVCSGSNHKAQSQWHRHRRHTRCAAQACTTSIQRDLVPHHCNTHYSLTLSWLIKLLQLHNITNSNQIHSFLHRSINVHNKDKGMNLTFPVAITISEKDRSRGVDVTWTPKNVPVLR